MCSCPGSSTYLSVVFDVVNCPGYGTHLSLVPDVTSCAGNSTNLSVVLECLSGLQGRSAMDVEENYALDLAFRVILTSVRTSSQEPHHRVHRLNAVKCKINCAS